ncbi:MAG TPA: aminoglycoside phosphotransferase family protein [Jatrophihabitantaceae bacterium]
MLAQRWALTIGEPFEPGGQCSWVAAAGAGRVLKIGWPHTEAEHEADGLRIWAGDGAVRLYAAGSFASTTALLLERCEPGTPLARALPGPEQDVVIAGLLRRLWRHAPSSAPFRRLSEMCDAWAAEFTGAPTLDPGIVRTGLALLRSLPRDATDRALLCTDLHSENVLAAEREPWLMIDPKPYIGDPAYDVVQHLLNADRLRDDPIGLVNRMAGLLDLDAERVRLWLFARCVQQSSSWPELVEAAVRLAP